MCRKYLNGKYISHRNIFLQSFFFRFSISYKFFFLEKPLKFYTDYSREIRMASTYNKIYFIRFVLIILTLEKYFFRMELNDPLDETPINVKEI